MTLAELMFSAAFVMMMNICTVFALLREGQGLRLARAILAFFGRTLIRSFPPSEKGTPPARQDRWSRSLASPWCALCREKIVDMKRCLRAQLSSAPTA